MIFEGETPGFAGTSWDVTAKGGKGRAIKIMEHFTSSLSIEQTIDLESYFQNVRRLSVVQSVRTCFPQRGPREAVPWPSSPKGSPRQCRGCSARPRTALWALTGPGAALCPPSSAQPPASCHRLCEWRSGSVFMEIPTPWATCSSRWL